MKSSILITALVLVFSILTQIYGQDMSIDINNLEENKGLPIRVKTESGATFQGLLYDADDEKLVLVDKDGRIISLLRSSIHEVLKIEQGGDKRSYYQDSASNRLLVIPTGFPMETGEFHVSDQEIAAVTMSYGLNEHVSFWGGISIPGALVSARYTFKLTQKEAFSLGTFAGASWIDFYGMFIPYAIFSTGSPDHNFTVGAGAAIGYDDSGIDLDGSVLVLGGKWVVSDSAAIVTENWIVWGKMPDYINPYLDPYGETDFAQTEYEWSPIPLAVVPGIAFRIAGEKFSWDIGAILPVLISKEEGEFIVGGLEGENSFIPIPVLSFTYRID